MFVTSLCTVTAALFCQVPAPQGPAERAIQPTTPATAAVAPGFKQFTHALGVSFELPKSWRVRETAYGLQLTPPDAASGPTGPTEVHTVAIAGANGVRSLDDRRAIGAADQQVRRLFPFFRSKPTSQQLQRGARRLTWTGRAPTGPAECTVSCQLVDGYVLSVWSVGDPDTVAKRREQLTKVFSSLRLGASKTNQRLPGTWYSQNYRSVGDVRERINFANNQAVTMLPNGSLSSRSQTAISGQTGRDNPYRPGTSVSGLTQSAREQGRWAVDGDQVYLLWKDAGVSRAKYYIQGQPGRREMLITWPNGNKVLWTEYN